MRGIPLLATALLGASAAAQQPLFFRDANLVASPAQAPGLAAAVRHLCAGPSAAERAAGTRSHLPAGTRLVSCSQVGAAARLTLTDDLLRAMPGCDLEHAIEQLDKTVLSTPGVTCAIPGTAKMTYLVDNLGAARGRLPDPETRERMIRFYDAL